MHYFKGISKETVVTILSNPDEDTVIALPPVKPSGGDVFVVRSSNLHDWKCDQYIWVRDGSRSFSFNDLEYSKIHYKIRLPGIDTKSGRRKLNCSLQFKKVGYWLHSDPSLVLVHYI